MPTYTVFDDFVSAASAASALDSTEVFPAVQSSATVKVTPSQLAACSAMTSAFQSLSAGEANTVHAEGDGSDHADVASNTTHAEGDGSDHADVASNTTHRGTTTGNPHSVTRADLSIDTDDGEITFEGLVITQDNDTNDHAYVPMILHGTDDTPPAASGFPRGTLYIQYTA